MKSALLSPFQQTISAFRSAIASASWSDYAFAVLAVGAAFLIYAAFGRVFAYSLDLLCLLAVLIAALRGGLAPGLLATVIAVAAGLAVELRQNEPFVEAHVRAAMVFVLGVVGAIGGENRKRLSRTAQLAGDDIREREAHLQSILDTVPNAMIVIDEKGTIERFSRTAEETFGYDRSETIGRNVRMLMPPPYVNQHDRYLADYLRTGVRRVIGVGREVEGLRKDGSVFPMELSIGEVRMGPQRMFTGFARDLSKLRDAEARQRQLQQELAHVWRLNSLGEFASTIAHEVNQPLAALSNYLRGARSLALDATPPNPRLIDALSRAGDQALRAGEIIRRTRSFLRREGTDIRSEKLDILLREVEALTEMLAKDRNIRVVYPADPPDARVMADKVQVQQVLLNLLRNAFDALQLHEGRKEVRISVAPAPQEMLLVKVEDSGPGVSPDMLDRLFQPMSTTRAAGMGLGLSISRTIIEDHGGRLWHESSPLGGAAFCLTLRAATNEGDDKSGGADGLHH
ncbi:PAS domain S-box protein [Terrarubrum flagellatum]|uniref:two-component system sensor histidine kinase NtrB n=1 Tax=Terrirubrum flagellatum TaxID=2895980 RepID=UPI00314519E2